MIRLRSLLLFTSLQLWVLNLYGQDQYLLMTRERHIYTSPTTLAEVPVAIAVDIIAEKLPAPAPVERKIREGALVKVISYGEAGKEKNKGRLDILNDSVISVGSGTIFINDIDKIFVKSVFSKVSGPVITCAGVAGTVLTIPWFLESLTLFNGGVLQVLGGFVLVPIAAAAAIGCAVTSIIGIVYFINGRVFNIADNRFNNREGWRINIASAYSATSQGP
jgi:hypothetical protein